ncbi:unnamed protein product [Cochlearia groenlandica]
MEGVGARLGRSSTRYGPATVFTGPVRKWKKKWVHVSPSTKKDNSSSAASAAPSVVNGDSVSSEGNSNGSHLLLYRWAPLSQGSNGNGNEDGNGESDSPIDDPAASEEPPRRRFKYVPVAVLEEQKKEILEIEEDDKVMMEDDKVEENISAAEPSEKITEAEEKPDTNDVVMEDNQEEEKTTRQDLNESSKDLGLNLDADSENKLKGDKPLAEES